MKKYIFRSLLVLLPAGLSFGLGILTAQIKLAYFQKPVFVSHVSIAIRADLAKTARDNAEIKNSPAVEGVAEAKDLNDSAIGDTIPENQSIPNNKKDSFSFAVFGDTQAFDDSNPESSNLKKAVSSVSQQNVDLVLTVGDLIFKCDLGHPCEKYYADWKNIMSPLFSRTYEVQGNHDRSGAAYSDGIWQKEFSNLPSNGPPNFSKLVYSFNFQNSHFVILNSEKPQMGAISKEQRDWLEQDLATHRKAHTFVFFHEPVFKTDKGSPGGCLDADPKQRDELIKIFNAYQVTAVFNGHEHIFSRSKFGNIYQFVVGDTDAPDNDWPNPSLSDYSFHDNFYAIVTVTGAKMNMKLYKDNGSLINSFDF